MTLTEGAPGAGLWLSRDNGATWKRSRDCRSPTSSVSNSIAANDALIHVTTFGGSVWRGPAEPGTATR